MELPLKMNRLLKFLLVTLVVLQHTSATTAATTYNIDMNNISVSGLSSGGFMASQLHFAHSSVIKNVAIFAGGPYFCTQGDIMTYYFACLTQPDKIDLTAIKSKIQSNSDNTLIDNVTNIKDSNVFLYSGKIDTTVVQGVVQKNEQLYKDYQAKVTTKYDLNAEHAFPTVQYGVPCTAAPATPFIANCGYNGAQAAFQIFYPNLKIPSTSYVEKNLVTIPQKEAPSMSKTAYMYLPTGCQSGQLCGFHIAFHGCKQSSEQIGDKYAANIGINEIAEANNIIVYYPQTISSKALTNDNACWDFWGYSDDTPKSGTYATKKGKQITAVWETMLSLKNKAIVSASSHLNIIMSFLVAIGFIFF